MKICVMVGHQCFALLFVKKSADNIPNINSTHCDHSHLFLLFIHSLTHSPANFFSVSHIYFIDVMYTCPQYQSLLVWHHTATLQCFFFFPSFFFKSLSAVEYNYITTHVFLSYEFWLYFINTFTNTLYKMWYVNMK